MSSNPLRVLWTEGMLISPQHLQQQDIYHETLVSKRVDALDPLAYGVLKVELDEKALAGDTVALRFLEVVLPDGTPIGVGPSSPELPPARPVGNHFPANQTRLEIFVGLPRERSGVPSAGREKGGRHRFVRAERSVADLQAEAEERTVDFAQRNPVLLFADEPRDDYVTVKIAEAVRDDSNTLVINETYVPPSLRVASAPFLQSGFRRLFSAMQTRRRALVEAQRQRDEATVEYNAADVTRFLLLGAINAHLPTVRYFAEVGDVHPRYAYLALGQLAGQLATFSLELDPGALPAFAYLDLQASFEELFARVLSLLHATIREGFLGLELNGREDGMFFGELSDDRWKTCRSYYLGISSSAMPSQEIGTQLPRLAKIASWQEIHSILQAASPGAPTQLTLRPPPQLPIRSGVQYFQIQTDNHFWANVLAQKQFALYLPRPFDPSSTSAKLLGILP